MTAVNWTTIALVAITWAAMAVNWHQQRHLRATVKTITDSDLDAIRLGWEVQRVAGRVGSDGCVSSGTTHQVDGRKLWITVSQEPTNPAPRRSGQGWAT